MNILAIESSCDETAASIVKDGRIILSSNVASQIDIHALYGGVVPEIASRAHTEAICSITQNALDDAGITMSEVDAIAVTNCPGLIGALLVGVNFAKSLAYSNNKPLIPVHHIRGHVAANYLHYNGIDNKLLEPPFTALVISGGHTSLLSVNSYTDYHIIGYTHDDAAGEAFDKIARLMDLTYPGGAKLDKLASDATVSSIEFPVSSVKDCPYDFSFSGLKTAAINYIHTCTQKDVDFDKADMALSFTNAVVKTIVTRLEALISDKENFVGNKLVLAGGVSANSHIRREIQALCDKNNIELYIPPLSLCGDNAAMIASQAYYEFTQKNIVANNDLNAFATMGVDQV